MNTQQPLRRVPKIQFRVLIIGRANAGKTSILQRVCETTESPIIYRGHGREREVITLEPSMDRGEHSIDDELVFSNHDGYVFHDSRGIESGSVEELGILQEFIRRKCGEKRLRDRLHAIWYCVPMDNQRPGLDLKYSKGICTDPNVPVIAVFTKYDQFLRNVNIDVEDYGNPHCDTISDEAERRFQEHYLRPLGADVIFVRLEQMHRQNGRCNGLIEKTAAALNEDIVVLMLTAVQKGNLELSVKTALNRVHSRAGSGVEHIVRECLIPFPYIWFWGGSTSLGDRLDGSAFASLFNRLDGSAFDDDLDSDRARRNLDHLTHQIMSLPIIQNLTGHHLILAVILILKHATFLCLSNSTSTLALTLAELVYQEANIDSKIQLHLATYSQDSQHSVELSAVFIMATDMVPPQSLAKTHVLLRYGL